jgi:hypothetical protein
MVPSFSRIGLFRGKMITLCGRLTKTYMSSHATLTKEEFEVVKFVENKSLFAIFLGKT